MKNKEKLPVQLKEIWIEALRSGEFQQGHCALHPTPDTHCCLGVFEIVCLHRSERTYEIIEELIGLAEGAKLTTMNDDRTHSFLEIADYIETNL